MYKREGEEREGEEEGGGEKQTVNLALLYCILIINLLSLCRFFDVPLLLFTLIYAVFLCSYILLLTHHFVIDKVQ